jgi:hypothetical protein
MTDSLVLRVEHRRQEQVLCADDLRARPPGLLCSSLDDTTGYGADLPGQAATAAGHDHEPSDTRFSARRPRPAR